MSEVCLPCEYCGTDRDGFSEYLPRVGKGNAHIWKSSIEGWIIDIRGPYRTGLTIKIDYCPKCGRKLSR